MSHMEKGRYWELFLDEECQRTVGIEKIPRLKEVTGKDQNY